MKLYAFLLAIFMNMSLTIGCFVLEYILFKDMYEWYKKYNDLSNPDFILSVTFMILIVGLFCFCSYYIFDVYNKKYSDERE